MHYKWPRKLIQHIRSNERRSTEKSSSPPMEVQPLGFDSNDRRSTKDPPSPVNALQPLDFDSQESAETSSSTWQVYEMTHNQKLQLLQKAIEGDVHSRSESLDKAQRFRRYYDKTAEEFGLKHEAIEDAPLRLLCRADTIQKLESGGFDCPSFVALSYCWRDGSWTLASHLKHPEKGLPISPEIWEIINSLVQEDEGIWIDQICIDQNDEAEKRAVIGVMDLVYKSAREVLVPLEDVSLSFDEMIVLDDLIETRVRKLGAVFESLEASQMTMQRTVSTVGIIASARWFNRVWCFHEYQCHEECTFFIPSERCIFRRGSQWLREAIVVIATLVKVLGQFETGFNSPFEEVSKLQIVSRVISKDIS
ncbi:uncharacterized protein KY384_005019 [Bacidia gigantensis]|uniref:uncharacterized protein n=1 Tax=Bacidia gigantensis TaxID=2732470 RepID=UPI001D03DCB1|nr:uncharacterized protein KY384_005019 [Bacidia gigantensis]KAG8530516.1 hypothetical protein KY384_005019 [Bacidia gigantensis]